MRRSYFMDNPPSNFWDLIDFCNDNSLCACENLVDSDSLDDRICEDIHEATRRDYWYNIRDSLNEIPRGCDWYECTGELAYEDADDRFDDFLTAAIEEMDSNEWWDAEEDEEELDDDGSYYFTDDEECEEDEPEPEDEVDTQLRTGVFSVDEFISSSSSSITVIRQNEEDRAEKSRQAVRNYEEMKRRMAEENDRRLAEEAKKIGELVGW